MPNDWYSFLGKSILATDFQLIQNNLDMLFSSGTWINSYDLDPNFTPLFTSPCIFEDSERHRYTKNECLKTNAYIGNYYSWVSDFGNLIPWDYMNMCKLINGGNILFLGDSTQKEFYSTFVSAILATTVTPRNVTRQEILSRCRKNPKKCIKDSRHNNELYFKVHCGDLPSYSVIFKLSWFLDDTENRHKLRFLKEILVTHNISIVFLNTGAHVQEDDELIKHLNHTLSCIFESNPTMSILYRNTYGGHQYCNLTMASSPVQSNHSPVNITLLNLPEFHPEYKWDVIPRHNALIRSLISTNYPSILFIDTATSTNLRPDSHVSKTDCYHYCIPGPIDNWVILHYTALSMVYYHNNNFSSASMKGNAEIRHKSHHKLYNTATCLPLDES